MQVGRIIVGPGETNCYIVCDKNRRGFIIDPGGDWAKIIDYLNENNIKLDAIILTHCHYDHILAVEKVKKEFNAPVWIHQADFAGLKDPQINLSASRPVADTAVTADKTLRHGDRPVIGDLQLEIIHTPGHTPGGICILAGSCLFSGDTLFKDSVGRTDLVGGSYRQLTESVVTKLMPLPDELIVYPGHREQTTLGREKTHNPKVLQMLT